MAYTDINTEDRLVQATFAEYLNKTLGWESVYAWNDETFGTNGTLGRTDPRRSYSRATFMQHSSGSTLSYQTRQSARLSPNSPGTM